MTLRSDESTTAEISASAPEEKRRFGMRSMVAVALIFSLLSVAGVAGASAAFKAKGGGMGKAVLTCNGGMARLGHVFDEAASLFPGDPAVGIDIINTIPVDFFLLENVSTGTHTSTHLDAPGHFIEGGRTVDELLATDFVFPVAIIDVRDRMMAEGPDFQLSIADIEAWENDNKKIRYGSMVIIQTGHAEKFGTSNYVDDLAPGFAGETVQWLFDERNIGGTGSDSLGPDAYTDANFDATYTTLLNDGVAIPGLTNLDVMNDHGDLMIASAVALRDGSGYQVDPLGCMSR